MENVSVSLEKAEATFNLKPGKELQPIVLRKTVIDAGFTPRDIFISSRGQILERNNQMIFQPADSSQTFLIINGPETAKIRAKTSKEIELDAKVTGEATALSLEIQSFR